MNASQTDTKLRNFYLCNNLSGVEHFCQVWGKLNLWLSISNGVASEWTAEMHIKFCNEGFLPLSSACSSGGMGEQSAIHTLRLAAHWAAQAPCSRHCWSAYPVDASISSIIIASIWKKHMSSAQWDRKKISLSGPVVPATCKGKISDFLEKSRPFLGQF